ncbi:MAG: zinc ABC transporter substrate-binding protein [Clostridia bacterium]|nr:zinc ABC transporter substrate-binding protein [Clostridia bacterium]
MKKAFIILISIMLLFTGCSPVAKTDNKDKLSIVTTIFPLYDFARAVGGDQVNIKLLVDPGTEVHSFDPAPSDVAAIYDADIFFYIGGESDTWVDSILSDVNVNAISLIGFVEPLMEDEHEEEDEHIWTSPQNAVILLRKICDSIIEADNDNKSYYKNNCDAYANSITKADGEIRQVSDGARNKFILCADRFPFKYLTEYYGIQYEAAFGGCAISTDISIKTMNRLIETIKNKNIGTVYCTEMSNRNIANALRAEMGVNVIELHSAHNVTKADFENGVTYVDIMYRNKEALGGGMS